MRYRREHASGRQLPFFPLLEDLMRDVCDGAALLTVVHYYCPDLMKLEGTHMLRSAVHSRSHTRVAKHALDRWLHHFNYQLASKNLMSIQLSLLTLNLISTCDTISGTRHPAHSSSPVSVTFIDIRSSSCVPV